MIDDPAVIAAKVRAVAARERLEDTFSALQNRLSPSAIVHTAWSDVVDRGADAWETALDRGSEALVIAADRGALAKDEALAFVKQRPGIAAAAATAALALIAGPTLVRRALRTPPPPSLPEDPPRLTGPIPHLETRP